MHQFWHTVAANTTLMDNNLCLRVAQTSGHCGLHHALTHSLWDYRGAIQNLRSNISPLL